MLGVGQRVPQRAERVKGHHPGLSVPRSGSLQAPSTLQTLSRPQPPGGRRFATITLSRMRLSRYRTVETHGPTLYPAGQSLGKRSRPIATWRLYAYDGGLPRGLAGLRVFAHLALWLTSAVP